MINQASMTERVAVVPGLRDQVAALRDRRAAASITGRATVVASLRDLIAALRDRRVVASKTKRVAVVATSLRDLVARLRNSSPKVRKPSQALPLTALLAAGPTHGVLVLNSDGSFDYAAALGYVHRFFRGRNQARGQAIYTSLTFGLGGTVGGLYAGYAWERLGHGLTFTGAALCSFAGMLILWLKLGTGSTTPRIQRN
jgi:hypothetical protein